MWHYTEGVHNWDPIWTRHGIQILPGPSSLWLDDGPGRIWIPWRVQIGSQLCTPSV